MNNTEALELVQKCLDDWPYAATRVVDIMTRLEKVKELLKEQEPKPPIHVHQEYPVYCEPNGWDKKPCIIDFFKCPNCEEKISENTKYCSNCGQAVKWNK